MVKARCTQSVVAGFNVAAGPPSNQLSAAPSPTLSLKVWLVAPPSRKNLNPLLRLLGVAGRLGSGGPMVRIPERSGAEFKLYQKAALNSSVVIPVVGRVR